MEKFVLILKALNELSWFIPLCCIVMVLLSFQRTISEFNHRRNVEDAFDELSVNLIELKEDLDQKLDELKGLIKTLKSGNKN